MVWITHEKAIGHLLPEASEVVALPEEFPEELGRELEQKARETRGLEAFQFLWDSFLIPLARGTMDQIEAAVQTIQPDMMVVDQQALGGALVARKLEIP